MVELRWIKMFLFLILGLQFTAVTGQKTLYITVRDGDEATLSCENVMTDQDKCNRTNWEMKNAKAKSDRLSVTADCSLVIKKVTVEDAGLYGCQQYDRSGQLQGRDSVVYLSVVNMTEHKDTDKVKLNCSVSTDGRCLYTVQWVYEGNNQHVKTQLMKESQSSCSSTVDFITSHLTETSKYSELFKCRVTHENSGEELFPFISPSSDEDTKTAATTKQTPTTKPTPTPTTKPTPTKPTPTTKPTTKQKSTPTPKPTTTPTMGKSTEAKMNQTPPTNDNSTKPATIIGVAVGLASLLIIVLVLIRCKKTNRNKTQTDENIGMSLNTAVTPGTSQDMVDPEEGVSYASISYTKKTNSKARVRDGDDDDDDAVTYSTVKASSSSAGASTDPSNLYATVNKPKKDSPKI